jgi:hypothetical protein
MPARSPLEDMHWSFRLGTRGVPIVALPSLDVSDVPDRSGDQIRQAARWFVGPGRALRYLHDPAIQQGWRARIQAASALGSAIEWLACAVVPAFTFATMLLADGSIRTIALAITALYVAQLGVTEVAMGSRDRLGRRVVRIIACPVATTLFGIGGVVGAIRLLRGDPLIGKTDHPYAL